MKRLLLPLQAALTLAVLVAVAHRVDVHAAAISVRHASTAWLALALAMNLLAASLSARLWATLMPKRTSSYATLWRLYVTGLFYNNLGLGTLVGDGFRYAQLRRTGEDPAGSATSVLGERLVSGATLLALAGLGSLYFVRSHPLIPAGTWLVIAGVALAGVLVLQFVPKLSQRIPVPGNLRSEVAGVRSTAARLVSRRSTIAAAFGWACGVQCCTILSTFFLVHALGVSIDAVACFAVVPIIALAVLLPVSIQGIGVREASYILLFGFVGITKEQALSAAMLSYLTTLAVTAVGGVFALASFYPWSAAKRTVRPAVAEVSLASADASN